MINQKKGRKRKLGIKGFTLIEILIVVMVLGILAMVIVPQITVSTTDAKTSTLETNIAAMRNAIELYAVQHNNIYPGGTGADAAAAATAFVAQLTKYTNAAGGTSDTVDAAYPFGPYIKNNALPTNPFNSLATVACDVSLDITAAPLTTLLDDTGWYFYHKTGKLLAWDGS
ncbi:MAG: prepilin-type N-terminal cleavage/methylation domain-containing protein [Desulfobacula sp.]|nr:prepilin-type N-terminal cleavage/methylation domain-containing protein [Desulfobacula sp.]MBT7261339.1 prepilin-type N-terminal cleavage/methylation domain-containing protein [Desulfobacula sp.]